MNWWGRIFRRRHLYNDLSEELQGHIEEKTEQLIHQVCNQIQRDVALAQLACLTNRTAANE